MPGRSPRGKGGTRRRDTIKQSSEKYLSSPFLAKMQRRTRITRGKEQPPWPYLGPVDRHLRLRLAVGLGLCPGLVKRLADADGRQRSGRGNVARRWPAIWSRRRQNRTDEFKKV